MDVSRVRALRGPNLWCRQTAIEAVVSYDESDYLADGATEFETRLRSRFPGIDIVKPSTWSPRNSVAHALAYAALRLQALAGCQVAFNRVAETIEAGVYQVVVEYTEEDVGRMALEIARRLCLAVVQEAPFDLSDAVLRLKALNEDVRLGPSTGSIVQAASRRGIPCRRLNRGSLVQLGWGRKSRRVQAAESDASSAIGEDIAQDKNLTKALLAAAGVSVPEGRVAYSADEAWEAATQIGSPVVIKPVDGNQGKGVTVNVHGREQVTSAYEHAARISRGVIVERYFHGHDFRLLVVGDKLVAAARRDPPQVIGDGVRSIVELVERINAHPDRGDGHGTALTKICLDAIALAVMAGQGYAPDSIPAPGVQVTLRNNANLSTGGTATDVTDHVHPDLAACAVAAAQMVGLDICGIDLVSENVYDPLDSQSGAIVEVNAAPGLRMHLAPSFGKSRPVGEAIVDMLFAQEETGRIPVVAVAGTNGKTTTVRLIAHLIACMGWRVGMTNSDGVYIGGQRIDTGDCSGPRSARNVLLHPEVDAAVFETARGGILREGLGFDRCDVAVVTNIGAGDHLGLSYISTVEDLAIVKRVIVENVAPNGMAVLNAADPMVAAMAQNCPGAVTFFAMDPDHPVLNTHRAQGRRVICVQDGHIVLIEGDHAHRLALSDVPLTRGGAIGFQIENVMAALGALWAVNPDWEAIRHGLATFVNDARTVPGRFNVFSYRGATLVADYGHNPDAIQALVRAMDNMPAARRRVVISGAGDRRDVDIRRQTEILGDAFDDVILYQDMCQRGRADGEVVALLRQGLEHARRTKRIREINGEFLAIDAALADLRQGDVCLILIDQVDDALRHITMRIAEQQA
ncbi:MAG: cyanophycin synthetase [Candidimonas sp.]